MDKDFQMEKKKCLRDTWQGWMANHVNVLSATELHSKVTKMGPVGMAWLMKYQTHMNEDLDS